MFVMSLRQNPQFSGGKSRVIKFLQFRILSIGLSPGNISDGNHRNGKSAIALKTIDDRCMVCEIIRAYYETLRDITRNPMTYKKSDNLSCRFCQHYQMEGRRGGSCKTLNVPVQGSWAACPLAIRSFLPAASSVESIARGSNRSMNGEKIWPLKSYELPGTVSPQKAS